MEYKVDKFAESNLCSITFKNGNSEARFMEHISWYKKVSIESFSYGNIGKYLFRGDISPFFFMGSGKGRKPKYATDEMGKFIDVCRTTTVMYKEEKNSEWINIQQGQQIEDNLEERTDMTEIMKNLYVLTSFMVEQGELKTKDDDTEFEAETKGKILQINGLLKDLI